MSAMKRFFEREEFDDLPSPMGGSRSDDDPDPDYIPKVLSPQLLALVEKFAKPKNTLPVSLSDAIKRAGIKL